jgi:hypothetical protein
VCRGDVGRLSLAAAAALVAEVVAEAQLPVVAPLVPGAARAGAPGLAPLPGPGGRRPGRWCRSWCRWPGRGCRSWRRGGRAGGAGAAAQPPVVLSRNGREYTVTGSTNVRAGTEIKVTTERPSVSLTLNGTGSRLVGDLRAAGIHHRSLGDAAGQPGCAAQASATSYYKGPDALWVKVVSNGDAGTGAPGGGTSRSRSAGKLFFRRPIRLHFDVVALMGARRERAAVSIARVQFQYGGLIA